jgi:hypothetical protein
MLPPGATRRMSTSHQQAPGNEERTAELREIRARLEQQEESYAPPLLARIGLLLAIPVTIVIITVVVEWISRG